MSYISYGDDYNEDYRGLAGAGYNAMHKYMQLYGLDSYFKNYAENSLKKFFGYEFFLDQIFRQVYSDDKYAKEIDNFLNSMFGFDIRKLIDNKEFANYINLKKVDNKVYAFISTGRYIPHKVQDALAFGPDNTSTSNYDAYLYIFGKNSTKYAKKLNSLLMQQKKSNKSELRNYVVNTCNNDDKDIDSIVMPARYNDTMYYSDNEMDIINNHISKYNDSKSFFEERQLNYKTGILLYGEPGAGKSTIAKVLATTHNRSIITVNMSAIDNIDFGTLSMLINNDKGYKYIVLLEDIDTLYNLNRESKEDNKEANTINEKKVINKLLQFLDSNQSPNDVIFIATTNHVDKLDPAILREGRFDLKVEVKGLVKRDAVKFIESFGLSKKEADSILKKYDTEKGTKDGRYNQSALQAMSLSAMK